MGGCQTYGPLLGTLNIRCRIIIGTQKGTNMVYNPKIVVSIFFSIIPIEPLYSPCNPYIYRGPKKGS